MRLDYSKLLGRIREHALTQAEVAKKIGVSPATLNKKLRGHTEFTQSEISSLCKLLGICDKEISAYFFTEKL